MKIKLKNDVLLFNARQWNKFEEFLQICQCSWPDSCEHDVYSVCADISSVTLTYREEEGCAEASLTMEQALWLQLLLNYGESGTDLQRLVYQERFINETCLRIAKNMYHDMSAEDLKDKNSIACYFLTEFPNDIILKGEIAMQDYAKISLLENIIHCFPCVIIDRIWNLAQKNICE